MSVKSDIEIAQKAKMLHIKDVAKSIGIDENHLELYGNYKAKISDYLFKKYKNKKDGKLVLVTAMNPTPAGEGKTTTTIGLGQALWKIGKKAIIALREPSLGPCMGVKGGAAGGGYSQVVPMEDINLHFTGDIHAISAAHNLLSALLDNHLYQGNKLGIDPRKIVWKRVLDMNDRSLRNIVIGLGGSIHGVPREDGFMITVASEIMAIFCLAEDLSDLKERLGKIIVAYSYEGIPISAKDLKADGAMTVLLKNALNPNLVQTLENSPALIHGGPFANIAHGCNSVRATKIGLKLADILVTEAGFGADLGAEKFMDIKCRIAKLKPDSIIIVVTIRSLKYNGGEDKSNLTKENLKALEIGIGNLEKHIENLNKYQVPVIVALNSFNTDTKKEVQFVKNRCEKLGAEFALSEVFEKGGNGGIELAEKLIKTLETKPSKFKFLYDNNDSINQKITKIAKEIYGASVVDFTPQVQLDIKKIENIGLDNLPICIAKTQYSFSDNPTLLGRPDGFRITIREIRVSAGAGFIVALAGDIMTMPGLPKEPAANLIDIDNNGMTVGLF